jgi:two-component system, LytTR family, response regulator
MTVRVLIVDDEAPARRKIRSQLAGDGRVAVVGEAASGPAAVDLIRELGPDLVFLDIQMPGMSGFEVIEAVGVPSMPAVVFVTAYDEFAVEAFEVQAVDYLLKPFQAQRLATALDRALVRLGERAGRQESITRLLERVLPAPRYLKRLVVHQAERIVLVPIRDVLHFSADGNYVKVVTSSGVHLLRDTLAALEARLDPERFTRIHRGEIVAIDAIKEIQPWFNGDHVVVLVTGEKLRLSRRYAERLLAR